MYTVREAAELLGVTTSTLRRWETENKIKSIRTKGGHRRYTIEELSKIKDIKPMNKRMTIGYCRVSSSDQKEDLKRQSGVSKGTNYKISTIRYCYSK